jgi:hypothetical protein
MVLKMQLKVCHSLKEAQKNNPTGFQFLAVSSLKRVGF